MADEAYAADELMKKKLQQKDQEFNNIDNKLRNFEDKMDEMAKFEQEKAKTMEMLD